MSQSFILQIYCLFKRLLFAEPAGSGMRHYTLARLPGKRGAANLQSLGAAATMDGKSALRVAAFML